MQKRFVMIAVLASFLAVAGAIRAQPTPWPLAEGEAAGSAKIWIGGEEELEELEEFLRTAEPTEVEPIGKGVTNPFRVTLAPGGPMPAFAWKPAPLPPASLPRGRGGITESYKTEVAAYELDKLLKLGMVPVTVERRVKTPPPRGGKPKGAACMWVTPTKSFFDLGGLPKQPQETSEELRERWRIQIIRAKMFDNLIGNLDPNLGNWLVDPVWNVILIDHSRSFPTNVNKFHTMRHVDEELWERMLELDTGTLTTSLEGWLNKKEIRGILKRRAKMSELIADRVRAEGEAAVFRRYEQAIE